MKKEAFKLLQEAEQSWWYKGRSLVIRAMITRSRITTPLESILDFGAGFGGMHSELTNLSPQVYAFEPEENARIVVAHHGYTATYSTSAEALSKSYSLIGLFDVIEHIEDDKTFLASLNKALVPDGLLVITVPAYQFLWSGHDVIHQHFRRYTRHSLSNLITNAGYEILTISYWDTFLFLPAAFMRLLGQSGSSALALPNFLNALLLFVVKIESKILRFRSLPFGVSLVVIARKK